MTRSFQKLTANSENSEVLHREGQCEQKVRRHVALILILTSLLIGVVIGASVNACAQGQEIGGSGVFGYVLDGDGASAGPGTVYLYTDDYRLVGSQPIGLDGFYRVECPEGVWLLRFEVAGSHPEVASASVDKGQSRRLDAVVRSTTATISGFVVDQLGMPIQSACVVLFDQSQGVSEASTSASSDGRFLLNVAPGHYSISGLAGSFAFDPVSVSVAAGEHIEITLVGTPASVRVSGQAFDEHGDVVPDVKVSAYTQDGRFVASALSGPGGEYSISLPSGVWEIKAWSDGWTHIGSQITIERGCLNVCHNLELRRSDVTVSGLVTDGGGNPLSGVWIEVMQAGTGRWATTVQTDESGRFAFEIAGGDWDLSLVAEGYTRTVASVSASSSAEAVSAGGTAPTGDYGATDGARDLLIVVMHRREAEASNPSLV